MTAVPVRLRTAFTAADKDVEDDDPYELVGIRYPVEPGVDADRELGRCFVEEYALLGWSPRKVQMLFDTPQFAGAYDIRRRRGVGFVDELLMDVFGDNVDARDEERP